MMSKCVCTVPSAKKEVMATTKGKKTLTCCYLYTYYIFGFLMFCAIYLSYFRANVKLHVMCVKNALILPASPTIL
jgi:hypothetical protein